MMRMPLVARHIARWTRRAGWFLGGFALAGLLAYYLKAQALPDLQFWHRSDVAHLVVPELEEPADLDTYLDHETQIFAALDQFIAESGTDLPRWHRYSPAAHAIYRTAWPDGNRSVLKTPGSKRGAALLVHGLSDSTHSMRALAQALYGQGFEVLNLRMPGHGTLPGALQEVSWQQFRDTYAVGVQALVDTLEKDQPLLLVGYSNGAALAVDYTLQALASDGERRRPDLLILLSPAMRVAPVAAYARLQRWLSYLPGMEKLGWTDVVAEFDPFKYNSFPVYAGEQIYRLTVALDRGFAALARDELANFPPVLAFQSILDATIPPTSFVDAMLSRLESTPAELVVFDINRNDALLPLLSDHGELLLDRLAATPTLGFDLTMVGNEDGHSGNVVVRTRRAGSAGWVKQAVPPMRWPGNVYSLSHVALPFDANDPVYGTRQAGGATRLGDLWLRGERGGLGVPLDLLARQRFNPFFDYLETRVVTAAGQLADGDGPGL